jgi:molybdopterin synthase sulfur carrier subunit
MRNLVTRYSELKRHLYTEDGKLRNFVNVYLNDEDVRNLAQGDDTPVGEEAVISIVPAIAGGW